MSSYHINFVRVHPDAVLPSYQQAGDNGMDVRAVENGNLMPGERRIVSTGLAANLQPHQALLVLPRSGLAAKHGITVANAPGLVDSSYRGVIGVILQNTGNEEFAWQAGDRIAQLLPIILPSFTVGEVGDIEETDRSGGFGSSGLH